jgi:hypothetical protein
MWQLKPIWSPHGSIAKIVTTNYVVIEKGFDHHPTIRPFWMAIETHFQQPYIR